MYTIVNDSLLYFKSMVIWNFDLQWKNYGTMGKIMVLWKKLWLYTKSMELRLMKEKTLYRNFHL